MMTQFSQLLSRGIMQRLSLLLIPLLAIVSVFAPVNVSAAGSNGNLSLTGETNVREGDTVNVTANFNPGTNGTADLIGFTIHYPTDLLEYVAVDEGGSLFPITATALSVNQQNGTVSQDRGASNQGVSTGGKIITVRLRAKKAGTATVNFSNTEVYRAGVRLDYAFGIKTVQIAEPSPNAPSIGTFSVSPTRVTRGSGATLSWNVQNASSVSITPGIGSVGASGSVTVKPNATTKYTISATNAGGTVSKAVTLTIVAPVTSTATPKPATTPANTPEPTPRPTADLSTISLNQSIVNFSSTSAIADGADTITVNVLLRREDGTVITDARPTIEGLRAVSDTASEFIFDELTQTWVSQITSRETGLVSARVLASGLTLAVQDLTFTEADSSPDVIAPTTDGGSSFTMWIVVGFIILILLLAFLIFLWRKLRSHDEEENLDDLGDGGDPAFPGDEPDPSSAAAPQPTVPPAEPAAPAATAAPAPEPQAPAADQNASFNPNQALQRSQTPPNDDTVAL